MFEPKRLVIQVLIAFVFIVVIDFIWLGFVAKNFYIKNMEGLVTLKPDGQLQVNYMAAVAVYVILALAISIFALPAGGEGAGMGMLFLFGFLLGLFIYGTYDMTNMATLKSWPLALALTDMVWGAVLCGTVTVLTNLVTSKFF